MWELSGRGRGAVGVCVDEGFVGACCEGFAW